MRRNGPARVLTGKVVTTFYRRLFFLTRLLDKPIPVLCSQLPVRIRLLTQQDLDAHRRFRPDQSPERISGRLRAGHRCYASWYQDQIVDVAWCAFGRGPAAYFGRELIVGPGDVYVYDSYTHASQRGYNLYRAKVVHLFHTFKAEGFVRNIALVAPENRAPLVILRRLGCETAGLYTSVGCGPWRLVWQRSFGDEPLPPMVR